MKKNNDKLKVIYYSYLTEYLLFSKQYESLLQEGLLDFTINDGYFSFLDAFVDSANENEIYPISIIETLIDFIWKLKEHVKEDKQKQELDAIENKIYEKKWVNSTDVYRDEYISRYATVASSKNYDMIPLKNLIMDIESNFSYLNVLTISHGELENDIGEDFLNFLNKLMVDFPEILRNKKIKQRILQILTEKNIPGSDKYIHMLSDKTNYRFAYGFDLKRVECLYCLTVAKKLLFTKDIHRELEKTPVFYFYQESFLATLIEFIEYYNKMHVISKEKGYNLREILYHMRNHLDDFSLCNQREKVISIINDGLLMLNSNKIQNDDIECMLEYKERIENGSSLHTRLVFHNSFKKEEAKEHVYYLISLTPEVFDYLLAKRDKCTFTTRNPIYEYELDLEDYMERDIVRVIDYLFNSYPRMFFDDTIYSRTQDLLNTIGNVHASKIKQKIGKIRKNN